MMDIVMLVTGAGVGAMLRDLFVLHRGDRNKTRHQLESKTPYDHALSNAINERDGLQDELRKIQALKRTEEDTERIRNEIGRLTSDDGEKATESVYGHNNGDVEHLLIKEILKKSEENLEMAFEFAKMTVQDDEAIRKQLEETLEELAKETRELRRGIREFREEGKYYGETLH